MARMARRNFILTIIALGVAQFLASCSSRSTIKSGIPKPNTETLASCPAELPAPPWLPYQQSLHNMAEFWIAKRLDLKRILLSKQQIEKYNQQIQELAQDGWPIGRWDPTRLYFTDEQLRERLNQKAARFIKAVSSGTWALANGFPPKQMADKLQLELTQKTQLADEVRLVQQSTSLRCLPTEQGVYEKPVQLAFDLIQCAQLRFGEEVRVLAKGSRYWYVWSSYADGWVKPEALTPPLSPLHIQAYMHPERFVVVQADRIALWNHNGQLWGEARLSSRFPLLSEEETRLEVLVPSSAGLISAWIRRSADISIGFPEITRERLLKLAFRLLYTPYGWGGLGKHRDCSQLMMDLFSAFGLLLPRNSLHQSLAGLRQVDVDQLDDVAKAAAIEAADQEGLVLLYMPGHIMLYLGRDGNHLYAYHQLSGYLVPCPNGGETMRRVNRVSVTALDLGQGSSRRSFLQRITRLIIFE